MMDIKKILSSKLEELVNKKMDEDYTKTIPAQTKEMDMHYQTFMKYYNGISVCPSRNLLKIAKYYGVSVDYLLGIEEGTTHQATADLDALGLDEDCLNIILQAKGTDDARKIAFLLKNKDKIFDLIEGWEK